MTRTGGQTNSLDDEKSLVRELLADRFQLAIHRRSQEDSVCLLVVAKNGPKLAPHIEAAPKDPRRMRTPRR